jgi:hypothetical protein
MGVGISEVELAELDEQDETEAERLRNGVERMGIGSECFTPVSLGSLVALY